MESTARNKKIVNNSIKKADKGEATVINDKQKYLNEAEKQQQDKEVYKRLHEDTTNTINKEINIFLQEAEDDGIICIDIKKSLIKDYPREPIMYLVLKSTRM